MKKLLSILTSIVLFASITAVSGVAATDISNVSVYSRSSMTFAGSGHIEGDGIIADGEISGNNNPWATGSIYKSPSATYNRPAHYDGNDSIIKDYSGEILSFSPKQTQAFPGVSYFQNKSTSYKDGTQDLVIGWSSGEQSSGYTITEDSYIRKLEVKDTLTLNITVPDDGMRIIRVGKLYNRGHIVVSGSGTLILFVDEEISTGNGGTLNAKSGFGLSEKVTLVFGNMDTVRIDNYTISANIVALQSDIVFNNLQFKGNVYTNKDFEMTNSVHAYGLVYAPFGKSVLKNGCYITGMLYTNTFEVSGSCYVEKGAILGLPSRVTGLIGSITDPLLGESGGSGGNSGTSSTGGNSSGSGSSSSGSSDQTVQIKVTVARRMSIRLEDGTILKDGDTFTMPAYGTIRFQMCTNNWDTDTYTDMGQGIAGTKVFTFTHQKNKERVLRVDNDRHFKPVRFHFLKGDYQKLTGVDQVLSIPLESLSVNFPLGATITVKAYVKGQVVETKDVFVSSDIDWINWNY